MPRVVGVHGIGHQFSGEESLKQSWLPALRDGLHRVDATLPNGDDFACAFYGDLFRRAGTMAAFGVPPYDADDVDDPWEQAMLDAWWREAAAVDRGIVRPEAQTMAGFPRPVQRALHALSYSRFFAGIATHLLIADLKQVRSYLHDGRVRDQVRARVLKAITPDTMVVIGHSLGSVVAYEVLAAHPELRVRTLVTLGSPLGVRNLIFDRLDPAPQNGRGGWPGSVERWVNVADKGDVVALVKALGPCFGGKVDDRLVDNGAKAHGAGPYLTAKETGDAVAHGLSG